MYNPVRLKDVIDETTNQTIITNESIQNKFEEYKGIYDQFLPPYFRNFKSVNDIDDIKLRGLVHFFSLSLIEYKVMIDLLKNSDVLESFKNLAVSIHSLDDNLGYIDVLKGINSKNLTQVFEASDRINSVVNYQSTCSNTLPPLKSRGQYMTSNYLKFNLTNDVESYQDVIDIVENETGGYTYEPEY